MPVIHKWDNDAKSVYTFIMRGKWDWSEFQEALRCGYDEIKAVEHQVDVIYAYISALPEGDAIQYMMMASEQQPENCYRSVMVDPRKDILQIIVGAIDDINNWDGPEFTESMDEARQYLQESEA